MLPLDLGERAGRACDRLGIPYYITGSLASSYHGSYRTTLDVDVVVQLGAQDAPSEEWYVSVDAARDAARHHGMFNVIHSPTSQKIDFIVAPLDAFQRSAMARAFGVEVDGRKMRMAAAEDVILSKLRFYREGRSAKHLTDIASVLKVSGAGLDRGYLDQWVRQLGVEDEWASVRAGLDPSRSP